MTTTNKPQCSVPTAIWSQRLDGAVHVALRVPQTKRCYQSEQV